MKKNIIIGSIVVLVAAASFYGGMLYSAKGKTGPSDFSQNLSQGRNNMGSGARRGGAQSGGGLVNGSILSQDDKSLTVKLSDGGSKIIFLSSSTQIMKMASSSKDQLLPGNNLMITGSANADGSVLAQTIQIRPEIVPGFNGLK